MKDVKTVECPKFPTDFANRLKKGELRLIPVNWSCGTMRLNHEGKPLFCIMGSENQTAAEFLIEEVIP